MWRERENGGGVGMVGGQGVLGGGGGEKGMCQGGILGGPSVVIQADRLHAAWLKDGQGGALGVDRTPVRVFHVPGGNGTACQHGIIIIIIIIALTCYVIIYPVLWVHGNRIH